MGRKLEIEIVGNDRDAVRALGHVSKASEGLGRLFLRSGVVGAGFEAGREALRGLAGAAKAGWDEFSQGQKVAAQTAAVLKSTGGAANVTAKDVDSLATSLLRKSGVDDEAIKSGENMLLTFTNIRNEVGRGNDIFTQSTKTLLDMSTALGEDMPKAAIQLGKALNDPVKGVTALQRVGVTFTEDQKKQIAAMVDSGHTMDAQKLILRELNKEFGGSAEAVGKTLPGQLNVLKESLSNVAGDLVGKATPALTGFVQGFAGALPDIESFIGKLSDRVGPVVAGLAHDIVGAWPQVKSTVMGAFSIFETYVEPVLINVKNVVVDSFQAIGGVLESHRAQLVTLGHNIGTIFEGLATVVVPILRFVFTEVLPTTIGVAIDIISGLSTAVVATARGVGAALGAIEAAFTTTKTWISDRVAEIVGFVTGLPGRAKDGFVAAWAAVVGQVEQPFSVLKTFVSGKVDDVVGFFSALPGRAEGKLTGAWESVKGAIRVPFEGFASFVGDKIGAAVGFFSSMPGRGKDALVNAWEAVKAEIHAPFAAVPDFVKGKLDAIVKFWADLPGRIVGAVSAGAAEAGKKLHSAMLSIFDVLPKFVRDALDIHSPSKEFENIGVAIMEGTIKGMKGLKAELLNAAWEAFGELTGMVKGEAKNFAREMGSIYAGVAGTPGGAVDFPAALKAQRKADAIDKAHYPYVWGGGHNAEFSGPYDCSGAVSAVLHAAGLLFRPLVSGQLASWGDSGPGKWLTVFADDVHTFMRILGRGFGTSPENPGGGAGWLSYNTPYRSGFATRHWPALAEGGIVTRPTYALVGEAGPEAVLPLSMFKPDMTVPPGGGGSVGEIVHHTGRTAASSSQLVKELDGLGKTIVARLDKMIDLLTQIARSVLTGGGGVGDTAASAATAASQSAAAGAQLVSGLTTTFGPNGNIAAALGSITSTVSLLGTRFATSLDTERGGGSPQTPKGQVLPGDYLGAQADTIVAGVSKAVESLASHFEGSFTADFQKLIGAINQRIDVKISLNGAQVASAMAGGGLRFPGLAGGGIVKGGQGGILALVGEGRRDELVTPLPASGAGIGSPVHIHIHGSLIGRDMRDAARELAWPLVEELRGLNRMGARLNIR